MRLGTEFPQKWKEKSQKEGIALADILYGYAIEDLMQRISSSTFCEHLWLSNESALGESAYRRKNKRRLEFFYIENEKKFFHSETVVGDTFGKAVIKLLEQELFSEQNETDIHWQYQVKRNKEGAEFSFVGNFMDMQVPVILWIDTTGVVNKKVKEIKKPLFIDEKKNFTYFSYTRESSLAEDLFEIMRKLELISDMSYYDRVNEILKNHSISGRYIMDDFKIMIQKEPKVAAMKRLEQLSGYKSYGYMKNKWQQYAKKNRDRYDEWEIVINRLEKFIAPIWTALCEDEIFFDDWMPELERFLG